MIQLETIESNSSTLHTYVVYTRIYALCISLIIQLTHSPHSNETMDSQETRALQRLGIRKIFSQQCEGKEIQTGRI